MRFPGLSLVAITAFAAALTAPAMAQEWYARDFPLTPASEQASPICDISSGEALPLVAFVFEKERTRFAVRADEFVSRTGVHEYTGTLPSGGSFTVSLGTDTSSDVAVLTLADREGGLRLLEHFRMSGDFSLTGNGVDIRISALPSASREMGNLHHCLRELDNA
ncbi:hypothetical protein [Natronohydrobacter thiooxidans]|uniref:hypothetical protein n=1 Tax=Natronohydrobacter thiooxidans TaxID=87172 RepID=UPI000ABA281C|nr:hypothetical protein [Natronohydrobacter thiooxidans]